jgi:hypothetical protein
MSARLIWAIAAAGALVLLAALAWALRRAPSPEPPGANPPPDQPAPGTHRARLAAHIAAARDYAFWIGVPLANPSRYARAEPRDGGLAIDGATVDLGAVRSWLVVYANGEPLDFGGRKLSLPPGVTAGLAPQADASASARGDETVDDAALAAGARWIRVTHGPSLVKPNSTTHYATTLENVSRERVRVVRFGGYRRVGGTWTLHTVTGGLYDAAQFRAWYGLADAWIEPGRSATDPNNYGGPHPLWAYFCETQSGESFVAGAVRE